MGGWVAPVRGTLPAGSRRVSFNVDKCLRCEWNETVPGTNVHLVRRHDSRKHGRHYPPHILAPIVRPALLQPGYSLTLTLDESDKFVDDKADIVEVCARGGRGAGGGRGQGGSGTPPVVRQWRRSREGFRAAHKIRRVLVAVPGTPQTRSLLAAADACLDHAPRAPTPPPHTHRAPACAPP